MFTLSPVYTAATSPLVEMLGRSRRAHRRRGTFVLASKPLSWGTIRSEGQSPLKIWGKSIVFVSITSHESNQVSNYFNKRILKALGRQAW
jgi:hypothetical protein